MADAKNRSAKEKPRISALHIHRSLHCLALTDTCGNRRRNRRIETIVQHVRSVRRATGRPAMKARPASRPESRPRREKRLARVGAQVLGAIRDHPDAHVANRSGNADLPPAL
ncbi:hypothetical protein AzCIB_2094 [Azoarcus sp. CIB]|nr:hypothetical protein AzCIB_2094 [Azoarcus sp. CIB]